jgi:carboxyl-terminal processing protease
MTPARCTTRLAIAVLILMVVAGCGAPWTVVPPPTPVPVITSTPANRATATPPPTPTATTVPTALPTPTPGMSAEARAYLDQALDLMQQHSINRAQIDWTRLRRAAHTLVANALTPADTYPAIKGALSSLGDGHHSMFLPPDQVAALQSGALDAANPGPSGKLLDNGLAYLLVPGVVGSAEGVEGYAATVQRLIRELDAAQPCGWVVDLRRNNGGAMWPMLAGIGPLLGEGQPGAFVTPDGQQTPWFYGGGRAGYGDSVQTELEGAVVYPPLDPLPPVAVLTGRTTFSSGEAIAVAFRGRPDTRSFGLETGGLTTANDEFPLSDGAWILLTVSRFADRTGRVYSGPIVPDEIVNPPETWPDPVLEAAAAWLLSQPACAGSSR